MGGGEEVGREDGRRTRRWRGGGGGWKRWRGVVTAATVNNICTLYDILQHCTEVRIVVFIV